VADGGLFIALLESAMPNGIGFTIQTNDAIRKDAYLFGEAQSRIVVSVAKEQQAAFEAHCAGITFDKIGSTNASGTIEIDAASWGAVAEWKYQYDHVIEDQLAS
jgi:phosphoribosylformylglycinamidine synthase